MARAEELLDRARRAAGDGHHPQAQRYLEQASAAAGSPGAGSAADLRAQVEITRAYLEAETGDPAGGIARCLSVLDRADLSVETAGKAWQQLGLLHMRAGASETAIQAFARAISLLPRGAADLGYALLNRGNVHLQRRAPDLAAADFLAAREALDLPGLEVPRAMAEHNLGCARMLTGDLVGALRTIDSAAGTLSVSAVNRAMVEQDRAEVLTAAGRSREAARALERAAQAYGSRRLRTYQAECELTLAWTLLREDPAKARVVARRAARRFGRQASPARELRAGAVALVAEILAGSRSRTLLSRVDAVSAELRAQGFGHDATVLRLQGARVSVGRGDLDDARGRLRHLRVEASAPVTTRLLWREVRAELARARGDDRRARGHVRAGLADLHTWQSSFGSLDLQSTLVDHGRDLATHGLALALDSRDPRLVFEWSERARTLVGRVAPVRAPADEQVARDLTELRLLQGEQPEPRTRAARRVEELRHRVRQRRWYAGGVGEVTEPADLDRLRCALEEDDAALVAHVVVRGRVTALVCTPRDAAVLDLGALAELRDRLDALAVDLTMAAGHRDDPLAAPLRAALAARLAAVDDQLVAPLAHLLGERRVVLTPSGALAGAPWSLLPRLHGRPLTIPPSATRWLELRRGPAPRRVGLVAGPGVARGHEEVTRAAAAWPEARVLHRADATSARVTELAEQVDLLHLAGHGRHTGENPLFSAVELADGPWFGYDVDQLRHTPSTVVLSACELGRVTVRSGEEAIGMSAAWLHAGARTVLSSPVLVADDVACEAMARWHSLVAGGSAPADALAEVATSAEDLLPILSFGAGW